MLAYLDASAAVKLLVVEEGTHTALELWNAADVLVASRLTYPEVRAALAAADRGGRFAVGGCERAHETWERVWAAVSPVELTEEIAIEAGRLAARWVLRGGDAVHLASALAVPAPDLVVAVWDRRLHAAVLAAGLPVVPARL